MARMQGCDYGGWIFCDHREECSGRSFQAGRDLTRQISVEFLLGCVVYLHRNQVCSPEIVANLRPEAALLTLPRLPGGRNPPASGSYRTDLYRSEERRVGK